jgi:hypothetical protein
MVTGGGVGVVWVVGVVGAVGVLGVVGVVGDRGSAHPPEKETNVLTTKHDRGGEAAPSVAPPRRRLTSPAAVQHLQALEAAAPGGGGRGRGMGGQRQGRVSACKRRECVAGRAGRAWSKAAAPRPEPARPAPLEGDPGVPGCTLRPFCKPPSPGKYTKASAAPGRPPGPRRRAAPAERHVRLARGEQAPQRHLGGGAQGVRDQTGAGGARGGPPQQSAPPTQPRPPKIPPSTHPSSPKKRTTA